MADHTISHQSVSSAKRAFPEVKTTWLTCRLRRPPFIFVAEFRKLIAQQIELHRVVHVDAHEFAWPIPQRLGQTLGVGNWLIKVHRCHVETAPFPERKDLAKSFAADTTRQNCRDELRNFRYLDISARYFVRDLPEGGRRRLDV